jgi:hypothetical protein
MAELLVNIEARVSAIGGGDPCYLSPRLQQCVDLSFAASHINTKIDVVEGLASLNRMSEVVW